MSQPQTISSDRRQTRGDLPPLPSPSTSSAPRANGHLSCSPATGIPGGGPSRPSGNMFGTSPPAYAASPIASGVLLGSSPPAYGSSHRSGAGILGTSPPPYGSSSHGKGSAGILGNSPPGLYGSSPPSASQSYNRAACGSSDKASPYAGAKRFWKRLLYDGALDNGRDFTVGYIESNQQQERRSGAGAWSLRVQDVLVERSFPDFVAKFPEDDVPFHRIAYFRQGGVMAWESEYLKKRLSDCSGMVAEGAAGARSRRTSRVGASVDRAGHPNGSVKGSNVSGESSDDSDSEDATNALLIGASDSSDEGNDGDGEGPSCSRAAAPSPRVSAPLQLSAAQEEVPEAHLPEACWVAILHQLDVRGVCMMGRVNRWLRVLSSYSPVWHTQYLRLFGSLPEAQWNSATLRRMCRRSALRAARWLEADVQAQPLGCAGTACLQLDETKVVSADGCAVRLWSHVTGRRIATLQGHTGRVTSVAFDAEHVVSGCSQNAVKVWGMDDLKCLRTLRGHESPIVDVAVMNGIPISASEDGTIKLWDVATSAAILSLDSPRPVASVQVQHTTGYLVSAGTQVNIWDISTAQLLHTLEAPAGEPGGMLAAAGDGSADAAASRMFTCVALDGGLLAAGCSHEVVVWDLRCHEVVGRLRSPRMRSGVAGPPHCSGVQLDDWKMVTGFNNGSCSLGVYDMRCVSRCGQDGGSSWQEPLMTLTALARINCFQFYGDRLLAGLDGADCHLWSFKPPPASSQSSGGQAFQSNTFAALDAQDGLLDGDYGRSAEDKRKKKPNKSAKKQTRFPKRTTK